VTARQTCTGCGLQRLTRSMLETLVTTLSSCFSSRFRLLGMRASSLVYDHRRTCMTTRRSALPVRMSYSVKLRSEPMLARTLDSDKLKRREVIVSVDV
jgi:hypothetical protein